jgi:predicted dehydrogenase
MEQVRIGIIGCGSASRIHYSRLRQLAGVKVVGCADPDHGSIDQFLAAAGSPIPTFSDHSELLRTVKPDALAIFTPHISHYKHTLDGLLAGCHVFVEKPLSTNVQEAVDIVNVARARGLKVGVGHQYRLYPSIAAARGLVASGAIGSVHLVTATLTQPWLETHRGTENSWRFDAKVAGGGILADSGDHMIDALLWSTGTHALEVAAFQSKLTSGLDLVTAAAIRLSDGSMANLGVAANSAGSLFELTFVGELGRLRATENRLVQEGKDGTVEVLPLSSPIETIDGNFIAAIRDGTPLCCPAEEALGTVRLIEAITRSATVGHIVRLG